MTGKDGFDILSFGSVLFEGRLKVTDKEKFLDVLYAGIGTGKAYGFGLLSIAGSG
jgi:CRISPR system Cascade subunit CasE